MNRDSRRTLARQKAWAEEEVRLAVKIGDRVEELQDERVSLDVEVKEAEVELSRLLSAKFYPLSTAAARLGLAPITVNRRIQRGSIIGVNIGGKWFALKEQIDREVEATRDIERSMI